MGVTAGRGIRFKITFKDVDDNVVDPTADTVKFSLIDSDGTTKLDEVPGTKETTGIYHYDYNIPDTGPYGRWLTVWIAQSSVLKWYEEKEFVVDQPKKGS